MSKRKKRLLEVKGAGRARRAAPGTTTTGPGSAPGADQPATGPPCQAQRAAVDFFLPLRLTARSLSNPPLATPAT
eukprot:5247750-Pyramimonas_sp.AAC.1